MQGSGLGEGCSHGEENPGSVATGTESVTVCYSPFTAVCSVKRRLLLVIFVCFVCAHDTTKPPICAHSIHSATPITAYLGNIYSEGQAVITFQRRLAL